KEVDKGSTVVLNVSRGSGAPTITVQTTTAATTTSTTVTTTTTTTAVRIPTVRGLAVTAGLRRLNTAGFRPVVRYVSSSRPPVRASPKARTSRSSSAGCPASGMEPARSAPQCSERAGLRQIDPAGA